MHARIHTHTHTHTHMLVIYKKGKKRRKVSRFSIHPLGDKITPLENDWSSHWMLLSFFPMTSCFFLFISSLCVYTCWSISGKVLQLLSHQDLAQGLRWPSWTTLLCLQSTGATPMRISVKVAHLSPLSRLSVLRREGFVPVFISSLWHWACLYHYWWLKGWVDTSLPTSHQQPRVQSKPTKDAIGYWEHSPGAEKQPGWWELVCAWAH